MLKTRVQAMLTLSLGADLQEPDEDGLFVEKLQSQLVMLRAALACNIPPELRVAKGSS